jgi:hypothetical protein
MMNKIYTQHWIELPKDVRDHLSNVFTVSKSGPTEVRDLVLVSDGVTNEDLARAFTDESLCAYIGSNEVFARAWEIALSKARFEINPPVVIPGDFGLKEMPTEVQPPSVTNNLPVEPITVPTAFCDTCDSKGNFHKKGCPKKDA